MKERIAAYDIAKGILICLLIIHHIPEVACSMMGIDDSLLNGFCKIQKPLFVCYFMQAFFMISGICSNFEGDYKNFLLKQIKALLIPSLVFTLLSRAAFGVLGWNILKNFVKYGGDIWFLVALFVGKIIYYWCHKYLKDIWILPILLLLSFLGTIINTYDLFPNYWYNRQVMDLTVMLVIGRLLARNLTDPRWWYSGVLYVSVVLICILSKINLPHVTLGFGTTICNWPLHVVLSVSGTIFLLKICHSFKSDFLAFWGRNSIVVYIWPMLLWLVSYYKPLFAVNNYSSLIACVGLFATVILLCYIVTNILNCKYLKWMIGR